MSNFEELKDKVVRWAFKRDLHQADPKIQWMRVTEEVGEIRDALLKPTKFEDPEQALKDALGDSLVTLTVLATVSLAAAGTIYMAYQLGYNVAKNEQQPIIIYTVDNAGGAMIGKVTGKAIVDGKYTLDCGVYGKFLVTKEQYEAVKVGDPIPEFLKGRGD